MTATHTLTNAGGGDAQAIIDVATRAADPAVLKTDEIYSVAKADGRVDIVDLEKYLTAPRRKTGSVALSTVDSFEEYVVEHAGNGTTVWVHATSGVMIAVVNDHAKDAQAWGDHRATLTLVHTPEWAHWTKLDGQLVDQEAFAEHIEDGLLEIVKPDGAELLEIAQTFHATTTAAFRSSKRLADGSVQFTYNEDIEAKAGAAADLDVPSTIELLLRPFIGEDPVEMTARVRFRLREGKLAIGYKLDRPDDIRGVLDRIKARLEAKFSSVYTGSPRS